MQISKSFGRCAYKHLFWRALDPCVAIHRNVAVRVPLVEGRSAPPVGTLGSEIPDVRSGHSGWPLSARWTVAGSERPSGIVTLKRERLSAILRQRSKTMDTRIVLNSIAALCVACAPGGVSASGDNGNSWTANGAAACERYLTPNVLATILDTPAGPAARLEADYCHTGSIYIHLTTANVEVFKQEVPHIAYAHPIAGFRDAAFWNDAGAFSAVKRPDRRCDISVVGPPPKIHKEALAQKLGEVCNKLFALP